MEINSSPIKHRISEPCWLSLSVVIANFNNAPKLEKCLQSIRSQDYSQEKIEILVTDGGSTDTSQEIARKYKAEFIEGGYQDNQEARRFWGIKKARNEIVAIIDTDNLLPYQTWFKDMVTPFLNDSEIFASQTLRYAYRKNDTLFNRYCALFGANDPVALYLKKQDRLPYYYSSWKLKGCAHDQGIYYKVKFDQDLPTVGSNGFLVRRKLLEKVLTIPEDLFHIDIIFDLVKLGYQNIAFVKNTIIHETGDSFRRLIKKRIDYFQKHSIKLVDRRRYKIYDSKNIKDNLLLVEYIFFTLTILKPFLDACRGFRKKKDAAWFMHPLVCLMFLYAYGYVVIQKFILKKNKKKIFKSFTAK
ncbi:MAG: glycosyltransferase family 2 protein [Candidatus Doudnabacteria bacterium]